MKVFLGRLQDIRRLFRNVQETRNRWRNHVDDRERINSLVEQYERPLCLYATRILGDVDRARDVVQDTFLRLCRKGAKIDDTKIAAWLYRVCRNRALDIVRKDKPMKALTEEKESRIRSREPDPADAAQRQESVSCIMQALGHLPDQQEEAVRLKFQHDMSYKEIAGVMEISTTYVGYLIHVGVRTLRTQLATS